MYQPALGRFLSRDPVSADGVDVLYDNIKFGEAMTRMRDLYAYARNSPLNLIDPSGLACRAGEAPASGIPPEDDFHPTAIWKPRPPNGYRLNSIGGAFSPTFTGVECCYFPRIAGTECCCKMDIEIVARAYRYYRFENGGFIDHSGAPTGVSNDPRDFFSIVVITVCRTNIICNGILQPDVVQTTTTQPLQQNGLGVFIRQGPGDIEQTAAAFPGGDPCTFAEDAALWIERNTRPGRIDANLP